MMRPCLLPYNLTTNCGGLVTPFTFAAAGDWRSLIVDFNEFYWAINDAYHQGRGWHSPGQPAVTPYSVRNATVADIDDPRGLVAEFRFSPTAGSHVWDYLNVAHEYFVEDFVKVKDRYSGAGVLRLLGEYLRDACVQHEAGAREVPRFEARVLRVVKLQSKQQAGVAPITKPDMEGGASLEGAVCD